MPKKRHPARHSYHRANQSGRADITCKYLIKSTDIIDCSVANSTIITSFHGWWMHGTRRALPDPSPAPHGASRGSLMGRFGSFFRSQISMAFATDPNHFETIIHGRNARDPITMRLPTAPNPMQPAPRRPSRHNPPHAPHPTPPIPSPHHEDALSPLNRHKRAQAGPPTDALPSCSASFSSNSGVFRQAYGTTRRHRDSAHLARLRAGWMAVEGEKQLLDHKLSASPPRPLARPLPATQAHARTRYPTDSLAPSHTLALPLTHSPTRSSKEKERCIICTFHAYNTLSTL